MVLVGPEYGEPWGPAGEPAGGGGGVGGGAPIPLPAAGETERLELLQAGLGNPVPLCYGRHIVGGSVILQHEAADGKVRLFIALGEGPWASVEKVWINGVEVQGDPNKFHFHPGIDGEAGTETDPGTPNQKICSFWPSGVTPAVTFSRTAYIALSLPPDPEAPGPEFEVRGVYQTRKVRIFDQNGNQTSFAYSANPAWCILDLLISRWLKPFALAGAELSTEEKARLDFAAWKAAADDCDYDIGGGKKRFECHVAFVQEVDTLRALEQLLLLCRGYLVEKNGKLGLYVDKDRSPVFTAGRNEIAANSLAFLRKASRDLANQFILRFRALDSGGGDPSKDFQAQMKELADEAHQDAIGRIIKAELDLGNQTAERAERLGIWLKGRTMLTRQIRLRLMPGTAAIDLLPGDLITAPDDLDYETARTWEVLEITDNPDGSRDAFCQEFDASIFTDTAGAQQAPTDTTPGEAATTLISKTLRDQLARRAGTHGQNLLFNPGFEDGSPFWGYDAGSSGASVETDSTKAYSGNKHLRIEANGNVHYGQKDDAGSDKWIEVLPSDVVNYGCRGYRETGDREVRAVLRILDKDKNGIAWSVTPSVTSAAWTKVQQTYTIPANGKYVQFRLQVSENGTQNTIGRFDDCWLMLGISGSRPIVGDSGSIESRHIPAVLEISDEVAYVKGERFTKSNVGAKTYNYKVAEGTSTTYGVWYKVAQVDFYVGPNPPASIKFNLQFYYSGVLGSLVRYAGDNIGLWLGTGTPPSEPAQARQDDGELIYNNPPANVDTLALYVRLDLDIGNGQTWVGGKCLQSTVQPFAGGTVS